MSGTINIKLTGMTCSHCVMRATKALEAVAGVEEVNVNLEQGNAMIAGSADVEKLVTAIKEVGYQAELA